MPGPPPKRANQRRRTNKPDMPATEAPGAEHVDVPDPDPAWHPTATRWYEAVARSGQARFYEPSDQATAYLVAEAISRELSPRPIGVDELGNVVFVEQPVRAAFLAALTKAMSSLMVTEGDRRRVRLELTRPTPPAPGVAWIDEARRRMRLDAEDHDGQ